MIPFNDLQAPFEEQKPELLEAIHRVAASGVYLMGPELSAFEQEFSSYVNSPHVMAVHSGTDALELALRSIGISYNDEVMVPVNAYPTAFGVAASGCRIRFCDVDPETLTLSVDTVSRALTKRTRAIIAVHLYGMPAPIPELLEFAASLNIAIIEDCAQAVGARINSQHVGTMGHIGCMSFYPTKNLGAMGDGGAVVTNDPAIAEKIRLLRMYGEDVRYHSLVKSTHSRLDEFQSAILRVRLRFLEHDLKRRRERAQRYRENLPRDILISRELADQIVHAYHLFVIRHPRRDELRSFLHEHGVQTIVHYPIPLHQEPAFAPSHWHRVGKVPVSERACLEVLSLPLYPSISDDAQNQIIDLVNSFVRRTS